MSTLTCGNVHVNEDPYKKLTNLHADAHRTSQPILPRNVKVLQSQEISYSYRDYQLINNII